MYQPTSCFLPKFGGDLHGPKRLVAARARTSSAQSLQLLSAWNEGKLASLLQTAWALVLRYYTGSEGICFGYQQTQIEDTEQPLEAGSLRPIQVTIDSGDSINTAISKVRTSSLTDCPVRTHGDIYQLFNTIITLMNYCGQARKRGLSYSRPGLVAILRKEYRVRLFVKVLHEEVCIFLEWWSHDMSTEHMKSMASTFEFFLAKVLSEGSIIAEELYHLPQRDWARICRWNSSLPQVHERCIHEVIQEQVLRRPEEDAICAFDGNLTYRDLDRISSMLACELQELGVGPEVKVTLCFSKSKWNIIAMLGVMKAGGAFIPLDPTHPAERLRSLVNATGARIMLCSPGHADRLVSIVKQLIPLGDDNLHTALRDSKEVRPLPGVTSHSAAYVIFTSGSSGNPKGVLVEHKAFCASVMAHAPQFGISHRSRVLQFAAHTFDASLVEILSTLMRGGCVCVPSEETRLSDTARVITEMKINFACLTPSFIDFIDPSEVPGLETVLLAGEAMSPSHITTWSDRNLINGYGPTESSVAAAVNPKVTADSDCRDIGFAVGARSWIVSVEDHNRLAPVGSTGELLLEGPTLARGYINSPEKTDEVFIYDPAWAKVEAGRVRRRFYKTGDLVRYGGDDGHLIYVGRKDTQVKLHGQRIELGEIESCISSDTEVKHGLVLFPSSGFAKGKIVAVVSLLSQDNAPSKPEPFKLLDRRTKNKFVSGARERLSTTLPGHMIPTVWLCLETLPFLTSGKLDRKSASTWIANMHDDPSTQPTGAGYDLLDESEQHSNVVQEQLVSIWSRVLNIPPTHIASDSSFLGLGGDSIAAITCVSHCKKHGIGLTVQDILRTKSIRELASCAKAVNHLAVYKETTEEAFDMSPIQKLHFLLRKEGQGHFNQSILTRVNEKIDFDHLCRAIETLVTHHPMLRARFTLPGPGVPVRQRITQDIAGSFFIRLHGTTESNDVKKAIAETQTRINGISGPILGVDFFSSSRTEALLSVVAHHLVVDIVSWRIILEDLEDLLQNRQHLVLQGSTLPFQAWCRLQAEQCEASRLGGTPTVDSFPDIDFAYWGMERNAITYEDAACEVIELGSESTSLLLGGCHDALRTEPIDIFLAAILHSFAETFDDRTPPVIYNEGHGRETWDPAIDVSRTVGWFTTLFPIFISTLDLGNPLSTVIRVKDLRRRVSDNGRDEFARRMLSSENKDCSQHYPMEISFNYVGQHRDLQRSDSLFQLTEQMAGEANKGGGASDYGKKTPRFALFETSAMTIGGRLRFSFSFNKFMYRQDGIRKWISRCHDLLTNIADQLNLLRPQPTLSDFPLLSLTYESLAKMESEKLPSAGIESLSLVEDIYPCSRLQNGILLNHFRDNSLYIVHTTFEVKEAGCHQLSLDRLKLAWQQVVSRHAILRTVFVEGLTEHDLFSQVVLKVFDAQPVYFQCPDDDVMRMLDNQQPIDHSQNKPAHRFSICQTDTGRAICRLELSHAVMDGVSMSIIRRDLQRAYGAAPETRPRPLFKNFIRLLREFPYNTSIDYWRSYLDGIQPCNFPVLNDGMGLPRHLRSIRLGFHFFTELQMLSEGSGITLSTFFTVAWGLTLRSYCGSSDVCFGYLASLRDLPADGISSVVGPVISLIPCRMKMQDSSMLKDILHQVQDSYVESLPYRYSSLIDIQHALKLSDTSLFNSGISYQKLPARDGDGKWDIEFVETCPIHDPAEFPVFINIEVTENDAQVELNYWTTSLSDDHAKNLAATFLQSLKNIILDQNTQIGQLDNLSERDREQLRIWNDNVTNEVGRYLPEVINEIAKSLPDTIAVKVDDESLAYSELDHLSSCLAAYLATLGVGEGVPVLVGFEKSVWAVISILAILKAGGGCVPLSAFSTRDSLSEWIVDNEVQVSLVSASMGQLLEGEVLYVAVVDSRLFECLPAEIVQDYLASGVSSTAYVVVADNSNGSEPMILGHDAILSRSESFAKALQINSETRLLQYAPFMSDLFVQEVFGPLICGGCVCMVSGGREARNPTSKGRFQANIISITSSTATHVNLSDTSKVSTVALIGGGPWKNTRSDWAANLELRTLYGKPESSSTCMYSTNNSTLNELRSLGLNSGCVSWLVSPSDHNTLVPIGCVGELVLEGPVLACDYFKKDSEAVNDFIEDPTWISDFHCKAANMEETEASASMSKRRMLKTGELVRYNSDGTLLYVGEKQPGLKRGSLFGSVESMEADIAYWKRYLADFEPCIFPSLWQRQMDHQITPEVLVLRQPDQLYQFSCAAGVHCSFVLQVAWGLVLRCYTGLENVYFAYSHWKEETILCKLNLRDGILIEQVLQTRKAEHDQSQRHALSVIEIEQGLTGDVTASLVNSILSCGEATGPHNDDFLRAFADEPRIKTPKKYEIAVDADIREKSVNISFNCSPGLLSVPQLRDVIDCFDHILSNIVNSKPGSMIRDLDFFTEQSCLRLQEWNATLPEKVEKCAHEVIREQALTLPLSTPAICSHDGNFTYMQLETISSHLAHKLISHGVGPEVFVALCFEKSVWAVVAQVAVLKAGGAFASLDPSHPEARLKKLAGDIGARVILSSRRHHQHISNICDVSLIVEEDTIRDTPNMLPMPLTIRQQPNNAAYAIFTSGSTGTPKITVIDNAAVATTSRYAARALNMDSKSRALQFSNYTFDVSVLEVILTLMAGGCICIPSEEERMNDLPGAIKRMQVNFLSATPGITNALDPKSVPSLATVITGGEKITAGHIERWSDRCVINAYGPSESTILATASVKVDQKGNRSNSDCNSIGTALCGRTWVVDPYNHNRLVPIGAIGELVLEGSTVARGYLNDKKKTNEVFINNPDWTRHDGLKDVFRHKERMYCTGDLVRYNSDGTLTFISRRDTQIKLNGQRIELEEIEKQCARYLPEGTQLAVDIILPESKTASRGIAAFFTIDSDEGKGTAAEDFLLEMSKRTTDIVKDLQNSLVEALPLNMIPKYFFPVQRLPFTTSGKLDRRGLRSVVGSLPKERMRSYIPSFGTGAGQAAESGMENTLKRLWEDVLELSPASVNAGDSFFGVGGDSYSAMHLVGTAKSRGITLTVADIFKYPFLRDMAMRCRLSTFDIQASLAPFALLPSPVKAENIIEEVAEQCGVTRDSVADIYPCSAAQEGLLTLSIKQRGAYLARPVFRLADAVDIEKFKAAWQQTVDQLVILRTRIAHIETANFLQIALHKATISWTFTNDLNKLPNDIIDLPKHNGGVLTGYTIVESGSLHDRYFIWTVHHSLYDGWAVPLILQRVEQNYNGLLREEPAIPYNLFIGYLSKRDLTKSDEFWMSNLANISSIPFPQNKNKLPNAERAGNSQQSHVNVSMKSSNMGLTLPVLIRAAWAIVVSAHTGSGDVCYGETLMGRNIELAGIREIAGPTLTTVPTRIQVDKGMTITRYLQDVHRLTAEIIPHQHSGLQHIRKLSNDAAVACDFRNLLVIQSKGSQLDSGIWVQEDVHANEEFFTHPLVIECMVSESKVLTTAHHDELVIDSWMAQNLIDQFSFVLSQLLQVSKDDDRKLRELDIFSPHDQEQVAQWNSQQAVAVDRCVHDLILERCLLQPEAMAIHGWDGRLSYKELCSAATSFAKYLVSRGVGTEVIVPICLDKSVLVPVIMLSILMTGGGFLPLDPSHPASRHEEILTDLDAGILLCSPHYCSRYSRSVKTVIPINKETIRAYGALCKDVLLPTNTKGSNVAYVLFTSGSTGRPRGIVVENKALASSVMAFGPEVYLDSASRVFQFASLTFDAAMLEIFATLLFGGCICVPSEDERLNDVAGAIRRMNVTWTFLTPAVASIIEPSTVPSVKVISCGGEAVPMEVVTKWTNCVNLIIAYGPTETTIFATLNRELSSNRDPACIGRGIPSTLTWVIDAENHDRLAPLGSIGELALEGPALAREYLKNPQKTAESFIDEPEWTTAFPHTGPCRRRIYKTGDLVKYNPDGSLEYVGRKDHQVKLNGQRMELGEIEFRLTSNHRVRHAVVILPKSGPLQKRLVAVLSLNSLTLKKHVVSGSSCELVNENDLASTAYGEVAEIRKGLESQLPAYMVPQAWAVIKELPMLVSDKTDRKRIANWIENADEDLYNRIMQDYDMIKRSKQQGDIKPIIGAVTFKALHDIVSHVLNLSRHEMNADRSFVSLGGDSITGMAVVSRARKQGLSLTLQDVLQSASLVELAEAAKSNTATSHEEVTNESFGLSPIQDLYFRSTRTFKNSARFNQGMTLRLTRRIESSIIERAISAAVNQHPMLRARFNVSQAGEWLQKITDETASSYRFRTHSVSNEREITPIIGQSQRCIDIQRGPVLAGDLFDIRGTSQILFLVASHLCVDMVSWRIILHDIQEFVDAGFLIPEQTLSFKTWCELQRSHSEEEANSATQTPFTIAQPNLSYWGMENVPNLYGDMKIDKFTLDESATNLALGECNKALRTEIIDILLSAVIYSFHRVFTDRDVPTLYNEGHGRDPWDSSIDLSRTVGWFTTLCPLGAQVSSGDILETIKLVKDIRRKIPFNGRPYFARSLLHSNAPSCPADFLIPLEIIFNYLGQLQQFESEDSLLQPYGRIFSEKDFEVVGDMGRETCRFALFEISAIIIKKQLHFSFTYNRNMQHEKEIQKWISECKQVLEQSIRLLKSAAPEPTLSDFPLLPATYDELKSLVKYTLPKAGISGTDQVEDIYPCSPMQEGILLSQLRDPSAYMFHIIFEVKHQRAGNVDLKRLENAWQLVVNRHSILRAIFIDSNYKEGSFDQLVLRKLSDNVSNCQCDDSDALKRLEGFALREMNSRRAQKISHQLTICKTSSERVLAKLEINHAIIDGGSVDILLRDFALAYNHQLPSGTGPRYSDYIRYIRATAQDLALIHWKQYIDGARPCHLVFDNETETSRQLKSVKMQFDRFPELQQFCERHSVTLANLTLSAWAIVLRRFTGSDDVCFGYPSTGRDTPVLGIQEAVGIFINMLCCRVKFTQGQTFADISRMIQDDYIRSLPHQTCSLARIQHEIGLDGQPLFNTTLSIQNRSKPANFNADMLTFDVQKAYDPSEYPVTVNVETGKGHEGVLLRYWTNSLSEAQAKSLAEAIADVFTSFIEKASEPITEPLAYDKAPLVDALEQHEVSESTLNNLGTNSIEKLIDNRVEEAISQMLKEGKLAMLFAQSERSNISKETAFEDNRCHSATNSKPSEPEKKALPPMPSGEGQGLIQMKERLWSLWSLSLGLPPSAIRPRESFFRLGGDSITAMKMAGAAREQGLSLTVTDVFNNPIFEDMVALLHATNISESDGKLRGQIYNEDELYESTAVRMAAQSDIVAERAYLSHIPAQSEISPKIGVFKGGIADVLPVTDFQALSIAATLFKSRWMLNYFYLDGKGPLDLKRLKEGCLRVVDSFDILRTVFVCMNGQFFQVILRKLRPDIFIHETEKSMDEFTETLQQKDREYQPQQGEQYVRFYVVKKKASDHHRILIRLSHMQFDGVCISTVMSALKTVYEGGTLPIVSSFGNYIRLLPGMITPDHYQHWRELLRGSKMPEIIQRDGPNKFSHIGSFTELKRVARVPSCAQGNITMATVIQAGWAMALAKLCAESDVVFGLTINGRNTGIPGVEDTVGPCVNIIPVRVSFKEQWTGLDLFRYLQDQQVANMPYESLGFREIIRHCTDWPDSSFFTTSVFHQNVDYEGEMKLDDSWHRIGGVGVRDSFSDLTIVSKQSSPGQLDITLGYSAKGAISPSLAAESLDLLCETVERLAANPGAFLPSASTLRSLTSHTASDPPGLSDESLLASHLKSRSVADLLVHSNILTRTWQQALSASTTAASQPFRLDTSFFDLGGDLFSMAQVAWLLDQEGLQARLEDLLEHPTFLGQLAVLALYNHSQDRDTSQETEARAGAGAQLPGKENPVETSRAENRRAWGKAVLLARKFTKRLDF